MGRDLPFPESGTYVFPRRARPARGRPRVRPLRVLGAERLGAAPRRLNGCAFSRSSTRPTRPRASSPTPCASAATSSTSGSSPRLVRIRPPRSRLYGAVLVFGGAMHVDQEERHGWLREENALLQRLLAGRRADSSASASAASLSRRRWARPSRRMPSPEIGWFDVELTPEAAEDPVFAVCPSPSRHFSGTCYHFELPDGGVALARQRPVPAGLQGRRRPGASSSIRDHAGGPGRAGCGPWTRRRTARSTSRPSAPRPRSTSRAGTRSGGTCAGDSSRPRKMPALRVPTRPLVPRARVVDGVNVRRAQKSGGDLRPLARVAVGHHAATLGDPA